MDTLTVTTAMAGLLAVGGHATDILWDLNSTPKTNRVVASQALREVRECRSSIHVLSKTLPLLQSGHLQFPERATWIDVDELVATLTDTVLAFSKLHALCDALEAEAAVSSPGEACDRFEKRIRALCARIRWHNLSMTMMMTVLQWQATRGDAP
ncbi:hypothetical protein G7046_g8397 [Stylonectria norvegica]|nr:hypothetical protein G7046_g8397 [Stylonectria norvegica]